MPLLVCCAFVCARQCALYMQLCVCICICTYTHLFRCCTTNLQGNIGPGGSAEKGKKQLMIEWWDWFALHTWLILSSFGILFALLSFMEENGVLQVAEGRPWVKGVLAWSLVLRTFLFLYNIFYGKQIFGGASTGFHKESSATPRHRVDLYGVVPSMKCLFFRMLMTCSESFCRTDKHPNPFPNERSNMLTSLRHSGVLTRDSYFMFLLGYGISKEEGVAARVKRASRLYTRTSTNQDVAE